MITITFNPTTPEQMATLARAMLSYIRPDGLRPSTNMQPEEIDGTPPTNLAPLDLGDPVKIKRASPKKAVVAVETPVVKEESTLITLEQLRAKMAAKSQAGKGPECKALLATFGANNLTTLPVEKYSDLLAAVEAL
jgi:hypothetical protein